MSIIGKPTSGLLYYSWVIPAIVFAVVTFLCYLRFLAHLPKRMKRLLFAAGSIFVMGAIGMEMLSSRLQSPYGWRNWETIPDSIKIIIGLQTAVEELFEMIGVVIFVYALLSYVSSYVGEITLQFHGDNN
jgi:hypothetical protein